MASRLGFIAFTLGLALRATALPGNSEAGQRIRDAIRSQVHENGTLTLWPCFSSYCQKPQKAHERILPTPPGIQWMDRGGFCGSWSIQRSALAKGAWISQAQVRAHSSPGGGHDTEILATNIDAALQRLKLKAEGWDYKTQPRPQKDAYRKWIKSKLVAGHAVVWMIMQPGEAYPVYPGLPKDSPYGHIEPVVGIMSDHPLDDTTLYEDDVVVHYTDADTHTYYRTMESLPDNVNYTGNCRDSGYTGYPCINDQLGFGWAIEGFLDSQDGLPTSLSIDPSTSEAEFPGQVGPWCPWKVTGTLAIEGLKSGNKYVVYRWDSVETAFDYSKGRAVHNFTAAASTEVWEDPQVIETQSATYYRCIADSSSSSSIVV
jgi:hypothetical protein